MKSNLNPQLGNRRIFPELGRIEWVQPVSSPPFSVNTKTRKPGAARGIRYERAVHKRLMKEYGSLWQPSPWFCYKSEKEEKRKFCQLDGILHLPGGGKVLVEAKYSHCSDAYFQLTNLYLPVIRYLYPEEPLVLCEVVKWYDPAVEFPCPVNMLPILHEARIGSFNVHIWNR